MKKSVKILMEVILLVIIIIIIWFIWNKNRIYVISEDMGWLNLEEKLLIDNYEELAKTIEKISYDDSQKIEISNLLKKYDSKYFEKKSLVLFPVEISDYSRAFKIKEINENENIINIKFFDYYVGKGASQTVQYYLIGVEISKNITGIHIERVYENLDEFEYSNYLE